MRPEHDWSAAWGHPNNWHDDAPARPPQAQTMGGDPLTRGYWAAVRAIRSHDVPLAVWWLSRHAQMSYDAGYLDAVRDLAAAGPRCEQLTLEVGA